MAEIEEILRPDDLDFVPEEAEIWRGSIHRECAGCGGSVEPEMNGRYCNSCVVAMER